MPIDPWMLKYLFENKDKLNIQEQQPKLPLSREELMDSWLPQSRQTIPIPQQNEIPPLNIPPSSPAFPSGLPQVSNQAPTREEVMDSWLPQPRPAATAPVTPPPASDLTPLPPAKPGAWYHWPIAPEKEESYWQSPAFKEGLRNISEGLGRIGTGVERGSLIRVGRSPNEAQPFVAEGLRKAIEDQEDLISPAERASFSKVGLDIPTGMTYSKMRMISPLLASIGRSKTASEITGRRQDIRDREKLESTFQVERGKIFADPRLRKLKEVKDGATTALEKLEFGDNPQAIRSAMVGAARSSHEVGVLTQKDIDAYEGKIGIPGFFNVTLTKAITGNFSQSQIDNLKELCEIMLNGANRIIGEEKVARLKSFEETNKDILERHGKGSEDINRAFGDIFGSSVASPGTTGQVTPQTDTSKWPKIKNPTTGEIRPVHPDDLQKYLNAGGIQVPNG